jgi:2-haloacid dehalogenase
MIGGPIPDGVRLLRRVIDSGLPCYALTNMEAETYPLRRTRYDFLGWFAGTVVSGLEGIAKPDREIYELLLERFSLDPASTLFVDDSPVNVAGAARAGMDAVLYTVPGPVLSGWGYRPSECRGKYEAMTPAREPCDPGQAAGKPARPWR